MALGIPLITYAINGGAAVPLAANASANIPSGSQLTLALQVTAGVSAVTWSFRATGTTLDGFNEALAAPALTLTIQLPVTPTTYVIQTAVSDGNNVTVNTNQLVVQSSSGGGVVVTIASTFLMPAAGTAGTATLSSTATMASGAGVTIPGYGSFIVSGPPASLTQASIFNTGAPGSAATNTPIPALTVVNVGGIGTPTAAAVRSPGQSLRNVAGVDSPQSFAPVSLLEEFKPAGDGVTDDRQALQNWINAVVTIGQKLHVTNRPGNTSTTYLCQGPLFLGPYGPEIQIDPGVTITCGNSISCPLFVSSNQMTPLSFPVESGLTCAQLPIGQFGYFNLGYTVSNDVYNWGDGNRMQLVSGFTQPGAFGTVSGVQVTSTSGATAITTWGPAGSTNVVYIPGGGSYLLTVVDATHVNLQWRGSPTPIDTITAGNPVGAGLALSYTQQPGFCVEMYVDPLTTPTGTTYLASSGGCYGSNAVTNAFKFALTSGGALSFSITTNPSGTPTTTTITSGASVIPNIGTKLTHVVAQYDGIGTASLYINGVRVGTASVTGPMVQGWYEQLLIGAWNQVGAWPAVAGIAGPTQVLNIAGVRISPFAMYAGASFTPPTGIPTTIANYSATVIDFAQRKSIIGPAGVEHGLPWVQAQTHPTFSYLPTWILPQFSIQSVFSVYGYGPIVRGAGNSSALQCAQSVFLAFDCLRGSVRDCILSGGSAVTLDGYSYSWHLHNLQVFSSASPRRSGFSWCVGFPYPGVQFLVIDGGTYSYGLWNFAAVGEIVLRDLWVETLCTGGVMLNGQGTSGEGSQISNCFFQSDGGITGYPAFPATLSSTAFYPQVAGIYVYQQQTFTLTGGYVTIDFVFRPQIIFDNNYCVKVATAQIAPTVYQHNFMEFAPLAPNQVNTVVKVHAEQPGELITFVTTGIHAVSYVLTKGSATATPTSATLANAIAAMVYGGALFPGRYIFFSAQPNTRYKIDAVDRTLGTITLTVPYSGSNSAGSGSTVAGWPWMPETGEVTPLGNTGQGALYLDSKEEFGASTINIASASGFTMWVNDFVWRRWIMTDIDALMTGTTTVLLPLIAGVTRRVHMTDASLTQSIKFQGSTDGVTGSGASVTLAPGAVTTIYCTGTGWILG